MVIDQDFICMKPLDEVVHRYNYFASFEPYLSWYGVPIINGGMQCGKKGLEIYDKMLENFIKIFREPEYMKELEKAKTKNWNDK